jgi:hypothetical protein
MATVSAKVFEHHKKVDGTWNVKIIIYHKDERKFIDTTHFVSKKGWCNYGKLQDSIAALVCA